MGTYYAIYAEVRVGNQWYNLNPLFQRTDGNIDVCPVISGRNWLREAYEELEEVSYTCGRPENMSKEVRSVFCHEDDEPYDPYSVSYTHLPTREDIIVILGDVGANYGQDERDAELKYALNKLKPIIFCIHGNHEIRPWHIPTYKT